jgi:uncharacterized protein (DUF488 family)
MAPEHATAEPIICTIGHSTHTLDKFIGLLKANNVVHVLDVRTVPRSRHNPQFNIDSLPASLRAAGISLHAFAWPRWFASATAGLV